tara:strand:- start:162 stop:455 length:294 start_codon:yes stop_codon:yes gene_type:complete
MSEETEVSTDEEEEEIEVRTDEEKAKMYKAMLDGANVITSVLDANNEFYNDKTNAEKQERVLRSAGYLEYGKALGDWGSEDFSAIDSAVAAAKAYTP